MTPVRFSIAVLGAIVFMAAQTPGQHAGIAPAEYQARRAALAKSIGPDALLHRVLERAGAPHRRCRLALPPGRQPPLPHRHERARHDAGAAAGRARAPRDHLLARSRSVERALDRHHPVEGAGDGEHRRPRRGVAAAVQPVHRRAVPGARLGCAAAERLFCAAGDAGVSRRGSGRPRRGLAGDARSRRARQRHDPRAALRRRSCVVSIRRSGSAMRRRCSSPCARSRARRSSRSFSGRSTSPSKRRRRRWRACSPPHASPKCRRPSSSRSAISAPAAGASRRLSPPAGIRRRCTTRRTTARSCATACC